MFLTAPSDFPTWVWLLIYGGSVVSALLTICVWVFRRTDTAVVWLFLQCTLIIIVIFAVADVLHRCIYYQSFRILGGPGFLLLAVSAGATIMLGVVVQSRWVSHRGWWARGGRHATCLAGYVIAAVGLGSRFYHVAENPIESRSTVDSRGDHQMSRANAFALTDAGNQFPLFRFDSSELTKVKMPAELLGKVMVIEQGKGSLANCHGWVFTGGSFLVRSVYVDAILEDNGYVAVESPALGDLIVYRNPAGEPVHTGLVKAVGDEGFVLIESKWGPLGTFLHLPEDQIYASDYAFFRSARGTHRLTIIQDGQNKQA